LDDVVDRLADQLLDLAVVLGRAVGRINIGHEVDEEVRHLVDELQRF
jgi:hypothetical protein